MSKNNKLGRKDIKNIQAKPYPSKHLLHYSLVGERYSDWALFIYLHFYILPFLFVLLVGMPSLHLFSDLDHLIYIDAEQAVDYTRGGK